MRRLGFVLFSIVLLALLVAAIIVLLPPPPPEWDPSPRNLVVEIDTTGYEVDYNHIPTARLWGDGRLMWIESTGTGARTVYEASLSESAMRGALQRIIDGGFFRPHLPQVFPARNAFTVTAVTVNLLARSEHRDYDNLAIETYRTSEGLRNAIHHLASGAGSEGNPYVPQSGFVLAWPADDSGCDFIPPDTPSWPSDMSYPDLIASGDGAWLGGRPLLFIWEVVNRNEECSLLHSPEGLLDVALLVPGVTVVQPP
jgi:hypothetical protein